MPFCIIRALSVVEVPDHKNLLATWRLYGYGPASPVGRYIVEKPLTARQLRRLPEICRTGSSNPWCGVVARTASRASPATTPGTPGHSGEFS